MMLSVWSPEIRPLTLVVPCPDWRLEIRPLMLLVPAIDSSLPSSLLIDMRRGARAELLQRFRQPLRRILAYHFARLRIDDADDNDAAVRKALEPQLQPCLGRQRLQLLGIRTQRRRRMGVRRRVGVERSLDAPGCRALPRGDGPVARSGSIRTG